MDGEKLDFPRPRLARKPTIGFRVSADLRMHLEESAELFGRTLADECLYRLEESYRRDTLEKLAKDLAKTAKRLEALLERQKP